MDEDSQMVKQVEKFHRIGKYEEKLRPIRIRLATQIKAEVINESWKLSAGE